MVQMLTLGLLALGCSSISRDRQGVLQLAGEATLGYYAKNKKLPTSREIESLLESESNVKVDAGDVFQTNLKGEEGSGTEQIELKLVDKNGRSISRTFNVNVGD